MKRAESVEKTWEYLDHEHADLESLQSCASLLPSSVGFSQKRDMLVANSFDLESHFDWSSLSSIVQKVFTIGMYRTATFRVHMSSPECIDFYFRLASEFERLLRIVLF